MRVTILVTAPGGTRTARTVLAVPVRRRPIPPFQRPLDVRARRTGDAVVVTWRTAGPARRTHFQAFTRSGRGAGPARTSTSAVRRGRGRQRFRMRVPGIRGMRVVVLFAFALDPPNPAVRMVVPIR